MASRFIQCNRHLIFESHSIVFVIKVVQLRFTRGLHRFLLCAILLRNPIELLVLRQLSHLATSVQAEGQVFNRSLLKRLYQDGRGRSAAR